ncbi:MAG: fasciclin domain-containing protein [Planctomycetes bacterium]|nr:fasciclin domain-containing protein [Planctomycetota bacterium]
MINQVLVAASAAVLTLSISAATFPQGEKDIVDTAVAAGKFQTLVKAVQAAGLVETLKGKGPFTVFAPTDAAFDALPKGALEALLANTGQLKAVLTYHVVPGKVMAADVVKLDFAETANGQSLYVKVEGGKVGIDGANVVKTDIVCSNGVIHVIDKVVLPRKDIVDTAVAAGSFKTLASALKAAGLVETLKGKGPFTVFAPTDEAFGKLPAGTVDGLLKDTAKLKTILTYHVVPGRVLAENLFPAKKHDAAPEDATHGSDRSAQELRVKTVEGRELTIRKTKDGVTVNGAKVLTTNVLTANGVIHILDGVVLPD